jgi:hypothetical protein
MRPLRSQRGKLICALLVDYALLVQDELFEAFGAVAGEEGDGRDWRVMGDLL